MNWWRKIGFAMLLCLAISVGDAGSAAEPAMTAATVASRLKKKDFILRPDV